MNGKFTPNVTNSWCHSRRKVILEDRTVNVRSLWEEKFLLMNPTFSYEITRIPYVDSFGKSRVYIVDFTDSDGNLYEIKPSSKVGESSEKILAARTFCEKNNLKSLARKSVRVRVPSGVQKAQFFLCKKKCVKFA